MKAMIFAAGLGTRLRPLTDTMPKALVPIAGKTLLEHVIQKLANAGFDELIVNIHHHGEQIVQFLKEKKNFGLRIEISDEREMLLDTGGGIKKAAHFFDDGKPFLIHNVDILSNADLKNLYERHCESDNLATLLVNQRETSRYLLFDENMRLNGWQNIKTEEVKSPHDNFNPEHYKRFAFSGIHLLSPDIFKWMESWNEKFPIMDFYLDLCGKIPIGAFCDDQLKMVDVGKIETLEKAEEFVGHPM